MVSALIIAFAMNLCLLVVSVTSLSSCQSFSSNLCNDVINSYPSGRVYGNTAVLTLAYGIGGKHDYSWPNAGPRLLPVTQEVHLW